MTLRELENKYFFLARTWDNSANIARKHSTYEEYKTLLDNADEYFSLGYGAHKIRRKTINELKWSTSSMLFSLGVFFLAVANYF